MIHHLAVSWFEASFFFFFSLHPLFYFFKGQTQSRWTGFRLVTIFLLSFHKNEGKRKKSSEPHEGHTVPGTGASAWSPSVYGATDRWHHPPPSRHKACEAEFSTCRANSDTHKPTQHTLVYWPIVLSSQRVLGFKFWPRTLCVMKLKWRSSWPAVQRGVSVNTVTTRL